MATIVLQVTDEETKGFKEAMDDVTNGRVTQYESAEDMFEKLGIAL